MNGAPAWHTYFEFKNFNKEEVFGALVLVTRRLEWRIESIEDGLKWTISTGIPGSANNETIVFHESSSKYYAHSESTGDRVLSEDENRINIDLLHKLILEELHSRSKTELAKACVDFINYYTIKSTNDTPISWKDRLVYLGEMLTFRRPWEVTMVLITLNILVFLGLVISGAGFMQLNSEALLKWGANYTMFTVHGEYWRLLTNTFLHGGFFHLLFNLYGLFIGGLVAENLLGKRRFLIAYLLCGIVASAFSLYMHDDVLSVGASGAIFGCFGIVLGMASTKILQRAERVSLLQGFGIFVGLSLLNGMKSGIDNWAHVGGLACGWIGGVLWALVLQRKERVFRRRIMDVVVPVIALGSAAVMVALKPDFFNEFNSAMVAYDKNATEATRFFPESDTSVAEAMLLKDSGLYYLDECSYLLSKAQHIKGLPKAKKVYLSKIAVLNQARRDVFFYFYKHIVTGADVYNDSIQIAEKAYKNAEGSFNNP